jgi:signal transduction histidine kinase
MTADTETFDVLLVEDNPGDAKLVKHHLRQESPQTLGDEIHLTHVESLDEALDSVESTEYDLLFLDLGLPGTSGLETLERVDSVVERTPIVVLTGLDDTDTALAAIQQGAQDYLPKGDIDSGALWRSLRYAVERERKEQQLLKRTEQLEFFSSILRHDVNNGMEVIKRNAEVLDAELDGDQRERAETIVDWSENITELSEKVRKMIQGITRGDDRNLTEIDLTSVVEDQVETVSGMDEQLTIETSVPFGACVMADEMLAEVFHNLLTNAVEHNDADEPHIHIEATVQDDIVTVEIADNGPGLPDNEANRLFSRGTKTVHSDGSGFGLYFVRTMVESYGGTIRTRQNEPLGTVFVLELPAA